ncbi:LPS export ABC transporter periplasmic protein LptC [Acidocella sp. KAb 2-4]|uniref:LPS export ABC transporter periplasmic protein LptC n=1 Tax=Acidocella sp. KAb 2-4 TaxID=2885158 RepID=UPI001D06E424|nr:LPS export ABC transporter periplasmic protein LptC [Acidocella sp. KAb 2-4]MCB5943218.1 LPS export ABC transporter periplasmic protein LptC [Acidocella sp. KAb 2-4]
MSPLTRQNLIDSIRRHDAENPAALARRGARVALLKKLLPVAAALLLVALALAPYWRSGPDADRVSYHVQPGTADTPSSRLLGVKYRGTDQNGQPFTVTADSAVETDGNNVTLTAPEGDITLKSGAWLMVKADSGLYHPKTDTLTLTNNVTLYRNDGTTLNTTAADVDLHAGTAASTSPVQVQGPFGTLAAANGFTVTGHGAQITFNGPATLTLMQAQ